MTWREACCSGPWSAAGLARHSRVSGRSAIRGANWYPQIPNNPNTDTTTPVVISSEMASGASNRSSPSSTALTWVPRRGQRRRGLTCTAGRLSRADPTIPGAALNHLQNVGGYAVTDVSYAFCMPAGR